ncbi:MAG: DUF4149 domain-containing protein [Thermoanaerobaculia bacterium]
MKLRADPPAARGGLTLAGTGGAAPVLMVHLAALALALGPPVFFAAVVAPVSFRVLPTRDMAAQLVSPILLKGSLLAEVAFGVLLLTSWFLTRRDTPRLTRVLMTRISVIGFFAALVIRQLIVPAMDKIRSEAAGLIDNLPAADPDRLLMSRYHRLATGFFTAEILAGLVILVLTARLLVARRQAPPPASAAPPPVPKLLDLSDL